MVVSSIALVVLGMLLGIVITARVLDKKLVTPVLELIDLACAQRDEAVELAREATNIAEHESARARALALEVQQLMADSMDGESETVTTLKAGLHMHVHGEGEAQ